MIVERDHHLATFLSSLANCRAGSGGFLVLTGPLARGKTTLLSALVARATDEGFLCLTAGGSRAERLLPLNVINQLCHDAPCDPAYPEQSDLLRKVRDTALSAMPGAITDLPSALFIHSLYADLVELSARTPVLITIDDLHDVDPHSLYCLIFLVRRIRSSRILVLAADGDIVTPTHPALHSELVSQATSKPLRLAPLSLDGVGEVLSLHLDEAPTAEVVSACHASSRGNPLLVRALAEDLGSVDDRDHLDANGQANAGLAFRRAIRSYLDRCHPDTHRIFSAAAILDETLLTGNVPPALTGRVADVDPAVIERTFAELEENGLLHHPMAKRAALESLPPADQATMHLTAARLLRKEGFSPLTVARHLLAAGRTVESWAISILRSAADQALRDGDAAAAIKLLQLAHNSSVHEGDRATLQSALLRAEWLAGAGSPVHRLPDLTVAIDNGLLSVSDTLVTVNHLLWFGFAPEAQRALARIAPDADQHSRGDIRLADVWTTHLYPGMVVPPVPDLDRPNPPSYPTTNIRDLLADVLETIVSKGSSKQALTTAEQTLQRARLDDDAIVPIVTAITVLIYSDHLETASLWCDRLLGQAVESKVAGWQAIFYGLAAVVALRQGRLAEVETRARAALNHDSPSVRGALSGSPVTSLLRALVSMGRLREAGELLEWPLPESIFQTISGLSYLQARGHYYLAVDRPQAALDDFVTCGGLMEQWGLDLPAIAQWRLDAAAAHLQLGRPDRAQALIEAQLNHPATVSDRVRGRALRLQAATGGSLQQRTTILGDAVQLLMASGDRLELARTLADLSHVYHALGDSPRARTTVRRAWQEAQGCHAYALCRSLPDFSDTAPESRPEQVAEAIEALSAAERRVAALASQGRTNHQIARRLFVTESTVEQHLTRVYRKLKVKRRADLPASIPGADA